MFRALALRRSDWRNCGLCWSEINVFIANWDNIWRCNKFVYTCQMFNLRTMVEDVWKKIILSIFISLWLFCLNIKPILESVTFSSFRLETLKLIQRKVSTNPMYSSSTITFTITSIQNILKNFTMNFFSYRFERRWHKTRGIYGLE